MDAAQRFISASWESSPTGRIFQQMLLTRVRFYRHPLYRRWSHSAYESRMAYLAEVIPEWLSHIIPLLFLVGPFVALFVAILFGTTVFNFFLLITGIILVTATLILASAGMVSSAALAAFSVVDEREAGRWELLMLLPHDRVSVLIMRISSMLYPYRPLISTLDVLQTLTAFMAAIIINAGSDSLNNDLLGACFIYFIPTLFMLTWERRQDYAISIALGAYAGLTRREQNALGLSLGGSTIMLAIRALIGMLAFGLSSRVNSFGVVLPVFIGGPAMMPVVGIPLSYSLLLLVLYYTTREFAITALWRASMRRITDWD